MCSKRERDKGETRGGLGPRERVRIQTHVHTNKHTSSLVSTSVGGTHRHTSCLMRRRVTECENTRERHADGLSVLCLRACFWVTRDFRFFLVSLSLSLSPCRSLTEHDRRSKRGAGKQAISLSLRLCTRSVTSPASAAWKAHPVCVCPHHTDCVFSIILCTACSHTVPVCVCVWARGREADRSAGEVIE